MGLLKDKWDATHVSIYYNYRYRNRKNEAGTVEHIPSYYNFVDTTDFVGTNLYEFVAKKKEIRHYRGSSCLTAYYLTASCWFRNRQTLKPKFGVDATSTFFISN